MESGLLKQALRDALIDRLSSTSRNWFRHLRRWGAGALHGSASIRLCVGGATWDCAGFLHGVSQCCNLLARRKLLKYRREPETATLTQLTLYSDGATKHLD